MENLTELLEVVWEWSFLPVAAAILLLTTVGSGLIRSRWKGMVLVAGLTLLAIVFCVGLQRHEWGEVLFNGQLL